MIFPASQSAQNTRNPIREVTDNIKINVNQGQKFISLSLGTLEKCISGIDYPIIIVIIR